jgi:hypothetical protein
VTTLNVLEVALLENELCGSSCMSSFLAPNSTSDNE